jgi:hypothetical protein
MNLELLDPFARQIPDRIESTLCLAPHLHFRGVEPGGTVPPPPPPPTTTTASTTQSSSPKLAEASHLHDSNRAAVVPVIANKPSIISSSSSAALDGTSSKTKLNKKQSTSSLPATMPTTSQVPVLDAAPTSVSMDENQIFADPIPTNWKSARQVSFNRRGTYLAIGYGSGTLAIYSLQTRTLCALFQWKPVSSTPPSISSSNECVDTDHDQRNDNEGCDQNSQILDSIIPSTKTVIDETPKMAKVRSIERQVNNNTTTKKRKIDEAHTDSTRVTSISEGLLGHTVVPNTVSNNMTQTNMMEKAIVAPTLATTRKKMSLPVTTSTVSSMAVSSAQVRDDKIVGVTETKVKCTSPYNGTVEIGNHQSLHRVGIGYISWSRHSRTILVGGDGDDVVVLHDTTHPAAVEDACLEWFTPDELHAHALEQTKFVSNRHSSDHHASDSMQVITNATETVHSARLGVFTEVTKNGNEAKTYSPGTQTQTAVPSSRHSATEALMTDMGDNKDTLIGTTIDKLNSGSSSPSIEVIVPPIHRLEMTDQTSYIDSDVVPRVEAYPSRERRHLPAVFFIPGSEDSVSVEEHRKLLQDNRCQAEGKYTHQLRFPSVSFKLHSQISGSLQIHPRRPTTGLAVLKDGSLVLFWTPSSQAWWNRDRHKCDVENPSPCVRVISLWNKMDEQFITCAVFDPQGNRVLAGSRQGFLLGFDIRSILERVIETSNFSSTPTVNLLLPDVVHPSFVIRVQGSSPVLKVDVRRDGKYIAVNASDGILRLYSGEECWNSCEADESMEVEQWEGFGEAETLSRSGKSTLSLVKPVHSFHDVVSRTKFATCCFSGDGEYLLGGSNGVDTKYRLYVWNAATGCLEDQLLGPPVVLHDVAWHPSRPLVAVATSDGLVDLWGPRINWTAFAPDFQALPACVEYIEREDEFDVDEDGAYLSLRDDRDAELKARIDNERVPIDIAVVEKVPVFASDSEEEKDIFYFSPRVKNVILSRGKASRQNQGDE